MIKKLITCSSNQRITIWGIIAILIADAINAIKINDALTGLSANVTTPTCDIPKPPARALKYS